MRKILNIRFKRLTEDAVAPKQGSRFAAGYDLVATSRKFDEYGNVVYGTGIAVEIPKNFAGYLFPRSSNAKKDLRLTNSVGVIDPDYRGEIMLKFRKDIRCPHLWYILRLAWNRFWNNNNIGHVDVDNLGFDYNVGERIGQLVILPRYTINFEEVSELSETERGTGSYGSTGK